MIVRSDGETFETASLRARKSENNNSEIPFTGLLVVSESGCLNGSDYRRAVDFSVEIGRRSFGWKADIDETGAAGSVERCELATFFLWYFWQRLALPSPRDRPERGSWKV